MAANIVINGQAFSGTPLSGTLFKPMAIEEKVLKIGTLVEFEAGNSTFVYRAVKREWTITWEKVPETTRAAIITLAALPTTYTFVDEHGESFTVHSRPGDHQSKTAFTTPANAIYYDISLTLHEV